MEPWPPNSPHLNPFYCRRWLVMHFAVHVLIAAFAEWLNIWKPAFYCRIDDMLTRLCPGSESVLLVFVRVVGRRRVYIILSSSASPTNFCRQTDLDVGCLVAVVSHCIVPWRLQGLDLLQGMPFPMTADKRTYKKRLSRKNKRNVEASGL